MNLQLENNKILVTGGSKGLGLACAKSLSQEGAEIMIVSRSKENLEEAAGELKDVSGKEPVIVCLDMSDKFTAQALLNEVEKKWGWLDGLIINAGGPPMGAPLSHDDQAWQSAFESLLLNAVRLTRVFVPMMEKQGYGRILGISSTGVKQPIPGLVLSNSIRLAVIGYLKTLANDAASKNILINSLLPGSTNTQRLDSLHRKLAETSGQTLEEVIAGRTAKIPMQRFGEPNEFATMATFLLSPANSYITGQAIAVDGGATLFPL